MKFNSYLPKKLRGYFSTGFILLVAGVTLSSCLKSKSDDYQVKLQNIMTINAYPDAPGGIYFYVGDTRVNSSALTYPGNTPYAYNVLEGAVLSFVKASNIDSAFVQGQIGGEGYMSIFVKGDSTVTTSDNFITPATGKAAIRFVNVAKSAGSFDVKLNDVAAFSDVKLSDYFSTTAPADLTNFKEFAAGQTTISLYTHGSSQPLLTLPYNFVDGKSYTIYTSGVRGSSDPAKALVINVIDNTAATSTATAQ